MKYQLVHCGSDFLIRRETKTNPYSNYEYFAGYDFMGGAIWTEKFSFDYAMDLESAKATVRDLRAAD